MSVIPFAGIVVDRGEEAWRQLREETLREAVDANREWEDTRSGEARGRALLAADLFALAVRADPRG